MFADVKKIMQRGRKKRFIQATITIRFTRLCSSPSSEDNPRPQQPTPDYELRENENDHGASLLLKAPEPETSAPSRADELRRERITRRNKRHGDAKARGFEIFIENNSRCQRQGKR